MLGVVRPAPGWGWKTVLAGSGQEVLCPSGAPPCRLRSHGHGRLERQAPVPGQHHVCDGSASPPARPARARRPAPDGRGRAPGPGLRPRNGRTRSPGRALIAVSASAIACRLRGRWAISDRRAGRSSRSPAGRRRSTRKPAAPRAGARRPPSDRRRWPRPRAGAPPAGGAGFGPAWIVARRPAPTVDEGTLRRMRGPDPQRR